MTLYTIAELQDGSFAYNEAFAGSGVVITDTINAAGMQKAADTLAAYAAAQKASGVKLTAAQDGIIAFTGLAPALYLAAQTGGTDFVEIQPVIVPLPYTPAGAQTESYEAELAPKYSFPGGAVILNKTDESSRPLGKAEFKLQQKVYPAQGENVPQGAESGKDEKGTFYWKELKTSLVTDENGQITVTDLPFGEYRFTETKAPEGFELLAAPVSFAISHAGTVKKASGVYVQDSGKAEILQVVNKAKPQEIVGSIVVTKRLQDENGRELCAAEDVFYVALFEDKERTKRISDVMPLTFKNAGSASVTFGGLKPGTPYYLGETTRDGVLAETAKEDNDTIYAAEYPEGQEITPTREVPEGKIRFYNTFYELPDGYYYAEPTPTPELTETPASTKAPTVTPTETPDTPDSPDTPDTPADTHGSGSAPVKTGDNTPVALYVLLLALAGIAAAGVVVYRKKHSR